MSAWRLAGLTYLEYLNFTTTLLRRAVNDSVKKKYILREEVHFKKTFWKDGQAGKKEPVVDHLADALKKEIKNMK